MVNSNPQQNNNQIKLRKRKPHFNVNRERRRLNRIEIRKRLLDFNAFLGSLGLGLNSNTPILIEKKDEILRDNSNFRFTISKNQEDDAPDPTTDNAVLKTLNVVDATYLSERNYHKIRTELELQETLPSLYKLKRMKDTFQKYFELEKNDFGYFLKYPLQKVEFVLKKIFEKNLDIIGDETIYIKLSGDGKVLTKVPRYEVAFWAQRSVQEFSYDIFHAEKKLMN